MKPPSPPSATAWSRPPSSWCWSRSLRPTSSPAPPGRPDALLRPAPLRTVRAAFTAHGSSKPLGLAGVQMLRVFAASDGVSSETADVGETGFV